MRRIMPDYGAGGAKRSSRRPPVGDAKDHAGLRAGDAGSGRPAGLRSVMRRIMRATGRVTPLAVEPPTASGARRTIRRRHRRRLDRRCWLTLPERPPTSTVGGPPGTASLDERRPGAATWFSPPGRCPSAASGAPNPYNQGAVLALVPQDCRDRSAPWHGGLMCNHRGDRRDRVQGTGFARGDYRRRARRRSVDRATPTAGNAADPPPVGVVSVHRCG